MKKGISLIVLVITIIVMIILAASVVITLSNTGVINRASEAVDLTNEAAVQDLAALIWADAYMDGKRGTELEAEVTTKLSEQGVTATDWNITVTDTGVSVKNKNNLTLGELITSAADYGKTVDYEANGVDDWKIFYHTNDYVYLIASEALAYDKVPTILNTNSGATINSVSITLSDNTTRTLGRVSYWTVPSSDGTVQNPTLWMSKRNDFAKGGSLICASYFLDETYWSAFKNTSENYSSYVMGAIGTPTLEMFAASWNAKRATEQNSYKVELELIPGTYGYKINGDTLPINISTTDDLYIWSTIDKSSVWFATTPNSSATLFVMKANGQITEDSNVNSNSIRPVVCLKASIPATVGTTTDFSLVK